MADFDQFESANPPNMEEDPAADFLAREQDELAGLEDDNPTESAPQDDFNAFGDEQPAPTKQEDLFGGSGLDDPTSENAGGLNGDLDVSSPFGQSDGLLDMGSGIGNQSGGLLDMGSGNGDQSGGLLDMGSGDGNQSGGLLDMDSGPSDFGDSAPASGPSDAYSAISRQDVVRSEPEKIKKWREEQKERLEKKDAEEVKKKAEWQAVAKKELEDWYKHHSEQLTKTHGNNLVAEKAFIKERDESVPGHEWEKICRLCEFNPKVVKSTKDVTRMRSILLQLKQTPLVK